MKLVTYPDSILKEQMPFFNFNNPEYDPLQLEQDLLKFLYRTDGIGLAANQVGIRANVFVMGHREDPDKGMAFFNPEVLGVSNETVDMVEGCLSFPGIFVKIKRPKSIKARWQTAKGELMEGTFEDYECKCFLHEMDHLYGVTMKDRISSLKWGLGVKKSKRIKN